MSLPTDLRDQLLTGYLDDALSADERARIERLLQSDNDLADELALLRQLRDSLKALAQEDAGIKLDPGFADRVLGSAVAQARAEGLDDDHPLVRLSEQPSSGRRKGRSFDWRVPAALVGLAASIAIAVFVLSSNPDGGPQDLIAESQDSGTTGLTENPGLRGSVAQTDTTDSQSDPETPVESPSSAELLADSNLTPAADSADSVVRVEVEPAADRVDPAASADSIARSNPSTQVDPSPAAQDDADLQMAGNVILVLSVQLSEEGRRADALGRAMRAASIDATSEKKVTEQVAGFVNQKVTPDNVNSKASVLYLQAPLKSLDQFYLNLIADEEGIASVGMTLCFNAPIARLTGTLRADPTTVRHEGRLIELVSDDGAVDSLAAQLGQLPYDFRRSRDAVKAAQSKGPDEMGHVLVLVR